MFLSFRSPNSQCPQMESRYHSQGLFFLWLRTSDKGISPCHMPHGFINSSSRLGMAVVDLELVMLEYKLVIHGQSPSAAWEWRLLQGLVVVLSALLGIWPTSGQNHLKIENISTFLHIQDALHVWKFQDYAWQSWSAIFPEVHPPLVSKVLFSECRTTWSSLPNKEESTFCLFHWNSSTIPFLKLSSVQLLRNVTLWRFIPQQKRLPPNWHPLLLVLTNVLVIVVRSILSRGYIQACDW